MVSLSVIYYMLSISLVRVTKQPITKTLIRRLSKSLLSMIGTLGLLCIRLPALKRCGVFDKSLVDKWLKKLYSDLPMLPG